MKLLKIKAIVQKRALSLISSGVGGVGEAFQTPPSSHQLTAPWSNCLGKLRPWESLSHHWQLLPPRCQDHAYQLFKTYSKDALALVFCPLFPWESPGVFCFALACLLHLDFLKIRLDSPYCFSGRGTQQRGIKHLTVRIWLLFGLGHTDNGKPGY